MIDPGSKKQEDETKGLKGLSKITLMIENDQLVHIADSKDGKDVWEALKKFHLNESIGHKLRLYKKLFKLELPIGNMQKHIQDMLAIV